MNHSADAKELKAKVAYWRTHAPSLKVTYVDDGVTVTDKRKPCREVIAHPSPTYKGRQ